MRNPANYRFHHWYIPDHMGPDILRYVDDGAHPGAFLAAVISGDLFEAVSRADEENMANLPAYVAWFVNEAPASCCGSREKMEAWASTVRASRVGVAS